MIKNERHYRIAKAQAAALEQSFIDPADEGSCSDGKRRSRRSADDGEQSLTGQLDFIRRELEEYEQLRFGRKMRRILRHLELADELPRRLIQARIAVGLTQKQLAGRLGLKEQQVQHYEATDYASASLSRVIEIARVLGAHG